MSFEQQILTKLADGNFHSGQTLADELGISRASIWNNVKKLQSYGLEVYSIRGKGYRLPQPTEVLDEKIIAQCVTETWQNKPFTDFAQVMPKIDLHWRLNSTNEHLMHSEQAAPAVCISEMQVAGRGRRGRQWMSPPGGNIYFSYKRQFNLGPSQLSALSLAVSVAVVRVLRGCGVKKIGVKWPNDIIHNGKKLAGILLEMQGESSGPCTVVVGVGINVSISADTATMIDQPWTDLHRLTGKITRRSQLVAELICELTRVFQIYEEQQLTPFILEWMNNDQLYMQPVTVQMLRDSYNGTAMGIDNDGNLIVENDGLQKIFASGEVSLRLKAENTVLI